MNDIEIINSGKVISRIVTGEWISDILPQLKGYRKVYVIYDKNVSALAGSISEMIEDHYPSVLGGMMGIDASEQKKNLDTVMGICSFLLDNNADRKSLVLGIGGGITTDMTGFAASIYKRGVKFAFVPTTLLAQVDAAIGGKTGVNFHQFKNMLGVIRQPEFTFICPEPLETLPQRDFVSGSAEMLKTFILDNGPQNDRYESACHLLEKIHSTPDGVIKYSTRLLPFIISAAAVKAGVVSRDQFENGERRILNLGHTFAHAIEHLSAEEETGQGIAHGEAVAMGIVLAAKLSAALGIANSHLPERLARDFKRVGLPCECPFPLEEMEKAMSVDKKAEGDKIHFILPQSIGHVVIKDLTAKEAIDLTSGGTVICII